MAIARPRKISEIKSTFGNLAQTTHYQVSFGSLPTLLQTHLTLRGVNPRFVSETSGLLCSSASLPGSSIGTSDIVGDVSGVAEKMANSRVFTPIDLTFYVDSQYKMIKFLEHWVEFISSGSGVSNTQEGYFFRMRYPKDYKSNTTQILKFDRDYKHQIEYNFYGLFPITIYSPTVSYSDSQVLTVTASFNYERYVCGSVRSLDILSLRGNNLTPETVTAASSKTASVNNFDNFSNSNEQTKFGNLNLGTGRLDDPRPKGVAGSASSPNTNLSSNSEYPNYSTWFRTL